MDRSLFGSLMNTLPHAIFWKDKHLVFQGCNKQFASQFGYDSPEDIIGKTDYDFPFPRHLIDLYQADDREIIETGRAKLNYEEVQVQSDGSQKIVLLSKVPYVNEAGEAIGILGIYTDITDRKRNEEQLKKAKEAAEAANLAKTEFLENMRHDIRTPLTGIIGFADILKNEARDPKIKGYADSLVASSYALLHLIDEVLESIRVSAGEVPLLKKKFDLSAVLQDILRLNQPKALQKKLDFTLEIDEAMPRYVVGDKTRLHRIALELAANALNFTESGFVKLSLKLARQQHQDVVIKFIVEDSGIGIPKEKQQDIYVQFKRLTPSYRSEYRGIGLGLSVVKQFIDDLKGEIYVDSTLGVGTKFTCILPLNLPLLDDDEGVDDEAPLLHSHFVEPPAPLAPVVESTFAANHRVLLVEDNLVAQAVAKSLLTSFNCQVDIASSRETAMSSLAVQDYELIFLDIGLPDVDGLTLASEIQLFLQQKEKSCPIVALTAHLGEEHRQRCYAVGLTAVVTKPLTPERCQQILNAYLPPVDFNHKAFVHDIERVPVFDVSEGLKNAHDEEMLAKILRLLVEVSLPEELSHLKVAYEQKDWQQIQKIAHKIKGGAVYAGTKRLHQTCEVLEKVILQGALGEYEPMYQMLLRVMTETCSQTALWLAHRLMEV